MAKALSKPPSPAFVFRICMKSKKAPTTTETNRGQDKAIFLDLVCCRHPHTSPNKFASISAKGPC